MRAASVSDYRELARRRLPNIFFEYIDGGSYAEATLGRNVADIEAIALRQRVMRDMSKLDMSVETLGQKLAMPVGLAPVGMAGMYASRGEVQAARAAAEVGVPFCLSTVGVCSVEEVAGAGVAPWFQLYMLKDRGYMKSLIERAKALGCPVLVFTVDLPTPGSRYRDIRSGFTGSSGLSGALNTAWDGIRHPAWTWDLFVHGRPHTLGSVAGAVTESRRVTDFLSWIARNFDRSVTWADLDWVRETWDGPIVRQGRARSRRRPRRGEGGRPGTGGLQPRGPPARRRALLDLGPCRPSPTRWAATWRSIWTAASAPGSTC